jgi:hypothetical protein
MKRHIHHHPITIDDQGDVGSGDDQFRDGIGVERSEGLIGGFEWLHEKAAPHLAS